MIDTNLVNNVPDWANKYHSFPKSIKIDEGKSLTFKFLDNGTERTDVAFNKTDLVFLVDLDGESRAWYVNVKNPVLSDVKNLGFPLVGKVITVSRKGAGRLTRYSIVLNKT